MKTYRVFVNHTVTVDDFEQGELETVNGYTTDEVYQARNPIDAIKAHFNYLGLSFNLKHSDIDHEGDLYHSNTVDSDNEEASNSDLDLWRKGKLTLYVDSQFITVYEQVKVVLTN